MPTKYTIALGPGAKPHLYIDAIKQMMEGDNYLHPMMKNMLLLMKKTRMPYVILATLKEIILVPEEGYHFERAIKPSLTGFAKIPWSEQEKLRYKVDQGAFVENVFGSYIKLGYIVGKGEDFPMANIKEINKVLEVK